MMLTIRTKILSAVMIMDLSVTLRWKTLTKNFEYMKGA